MKYKWLFDLAACLALLTLAVLLFFPPFSITSAFRTERELGFRLAAWGALALMSVSCYGFMRAVNEYFELRK